MSTEYTLDEILEGFETYPAENPYDLVAAAVARKEEVLPHLVKVLQDVLANPETYADDDDLTAHFFAAYLLGHFRETSAHDLLVDLIELPEELPYRLFGFLITEDYPMILMRTCGGSLDRLKSLVLNREAGDFERGSAASALAYAAMEGLTTREEVLSFLNGLFTGEEAGEGGDFWDGIGSVMFDLWPGVHMDTIRAAYDRGLLYEGYISREEFDAKSREDKDAALEELKQDMQHRNLDDPHRCISWWREEKEPAMPAITAPTPKVIKAKKKKRKTSKASKKKNRR